MYGEPSRPNIKPRKHNHRVIERDDKLHVVIVISNPCEFKRRWQLAKEFIERVKDHPNIVLYKVEIAYPGQDHVLSDDSDQRSLSLRTESPIWHKEPMVNAGIKKLLPDNWNKVAWIDADIEFDNFHWVEDTLDTLDTYDIVQMFSHAMDMDYSGKAMSIWQGAAYQYHREIPKGTGFSYWHPGYAWACTRKAYDQMGGLYDKGVLGSGDDHMFKAWMGNSESVPKGVSEGYKQCLREYTERCKGLQIGYVPGVIKHYFHGSKKNRRYVERWDIIIKHNFDPKIHLEEQDGLVVASDKVSKEFLSDIMMYFSQRNEDDTN
jgi:hypothetical protein